MCNNDQQASIFLQQKLKVGTPEQKYEIVEAIVAQAYPLMVNRFGNFLVQRCFEHGTPEQVIKIAEAIRGNTLNLSMDPFGCHVVQKAFDSVPENYKAIEPPATFFEAGAFGADSASVSERFRTSIS